MVFESWCDLINKNKYIVFVILGLFTIVCLLVVIETTNKELKVDTINATEDFVTDGLTLLQRMYDDVDTDGENESIELYTAAQRGSDGLMGWDDGQRWLLLVRDEEKMFPLFDDYVQLGQLEFWVGIFNKSQISSPSDVDLERHIYVMSTGHSMQISDYYWDEQTFCFKKEIVYDPPYQWDVKSMGHACYDHTMIESDK